MSGLRACALAVLAATGLAGCDVATTGAAPVLVAEPEIGTRPVPATRALALFDDICGNTLPRFASANQRLVANGFTDLSPSGTIFSPVDNASFRIEPGETCSFVFASDERPERIFSTFTEIGNPSPTSLGLASLYRDREAVVLYAPPNQIEGFLYYNVRLLAN